MPNYEQASTKKANPLLPLIGFIMILAIGGFSFLVSPAVIDWLESTDYRMAGTAVLPIRFPASWPEVQSRIVVTLGMFLLFFGLIMIPLFMVMGTPAGPTDINLGQIRAEKEKKKKKRRR